MYTRKKPIAQKGSCSGDHGTQGLTAEYFGLNSHTTESLVLGSWLKIGMELLWMLGPKKACSHLSMALTAQGDKPGKSQLHGPTSKPSGTTHTFLPTLLPCACLTYVSASGCCQALRAISCCLLGLGPVFLHTDHLFYPKSIHIL